MNRAWDATALGREGQGSGSGGHGILYRQAGRENGADGGVNEVALASRFRTHRPGAAHLLLGCLCQVSQAGRHIHQALLESSHQVSLTQTHKEELRGHAAAGEERADGEYFNRRPVSQS